MIQQDEQRILTSSGGGLNNVPCIGIPSFPNSFPSSLLFLGIILLNKVAQKPLPRALISMKTRIRQKAMGKHRCDVYTRGETSEVDSKASRSGRTWSTLPRNMSLHELPRDLGSMPGLRQRLVL